MTYVKTHLKKDITIDSIITIHYFEYMKDFVFNGEAHDFWEFMYVDKGSVLIRSEDDHLHLNTGDIIFHQPNEFHAIQAIGDKSPNLVAVSFLSHSPAMDLFRKKNCTLTMEERTMISHLIHTARETFSTPLNLPSVEQVKLRPELPFGSQQLILLYLELFLITVIRNHNGENASPKEISKIFRKESSPHESGRITKVLQYLEYHICEQLTIAQICEAHSLSRSALQSLFHKEKGCGVIEYFNNMKIQRAKDIIRDGTMNFTEIAYFLSYSSPQYFSKQFKKATGMSPLEYSSSVKGIYAQKIQGGFNPPLFQKSCFSIFYGKRAV